jgi:hypothetical protein
MLTKIINFSKSRKQRIEEAEQDVFDREVWQVEEEALSTHPPTKKPRIEEDDIVFIGSGVEARATQPAQKPAQLLSTPEATLAQNSNQNPAPFVDNQDASRAILLEIREIRSQLHVLVDPLNDRALDALLDRLIELEKRAQR